MVDMLFALVLSILIEGQPQSMIVDYSLSADSCEQKAYRINKVISQDKNITNIMLAKCEMLNVFISDGKENT